ncbi:MAG TPA: HAD family phosphatase [Flavisolibacter sp.]|jgi:putative hydrolase of the HAD superfamily|nr:HAD family phosphatase [Flavisolibacter sp.]
MNEIRNIIFDLGGIFINIDFDRSRQAFEALGISNFQEMFTQHHASNLFQLLERGELSSTQFHERLVKETGLSLSYNNVVAAWNALLLDFPPERLEWLDQVRRKYRVFLFSNTNQIHYDAFTAGFTAMTGRSFNDYFEKAYYSHEMGLRKPDPESFRFILKEQDLKPEETLFVDDTIKNIEAAQSVGLHTFHVMPPLTVLDIKLDAL